jgi:hypothetical protein
MKSFFEFYDKLKSKRLNEQDAMVPPNMGMGQAPPGGQMPSAGGMDSMGAPGQVAGQQGMNLDAPQDMGGMDQLDADQDEGKEDSDSQTAPPEGEATAESLYPTIDTLIKFVKDYSVGDDDDKDQKREELLSQLDAIKNNIADLTGVQPPSGPSDEESDDSVGANQIDASADEIPPGKQTAYGGEFGDQAGGASMPNMDGTGNMYGNMDGGSNPATTGGGALGFGGAFAG